MMSQNVINNTAYNYLSYYGISMKHLDEIKKLVVESTNTKFYLYKRLCELAPNSRFTEERFWFIVETDAEENRKLMDDIGKNFLINVVKRTRTKNKKGRHVGVGNLLLKIKVFK